MEAIARNRKSAERIAAARHKEIRAQEILEHATSKKLDFATAAGLFIRFCEDVKYRGKASTFRSIKTSFSSLVHFFGDHPVAAVDAGAIDLYKQWRLAEHAVAQVTLRHNLHALSLFFQHGVKQHWCTENWVRKVDIPSDREAVRNNVLSEEQEEKYFVVARKYVDKMGLANLYDVGRLMINQGLRPEEITNGAKSWVDLDQKLYKVGAGKTPAARRTVYLTEESCKILAGRMKLPGEWLFPSQRYPHRHLIKVNKPHDLAVQKSGVSFVLYDLRHTFATRMSAQGTDPLTLASILGHANLRTIQRYVHPQSATQKLAQERYEAAMNRRKFRVV
ncbi:MAG TPA: site-specific integrase [Bryobacteraceae bacterium]|nr:site-specific integrase [Bryobacteraceae bacterium]